LRLVFFVCHLEVVVEWIRQAGTDKVRSRVVLKSFREESVLNVLLVSNYRSSRL